MEIYCTKCKKSHAPDTELWRCECGGPLDIDTEASFPVKDIKNRGTSLWRYRETLPLDDPDNPVSLRENLTPLVEDRFRNAGILFKLDYTFPSGSFKDRGSAVMLTRLREKRIKEIIEDSSGNAGCSVAIYAARAGIDCTVYAPASIAPQKEKYIGSVGAELVKVGNTREEARNAAMERAGEIAYASHVWNPYFIQGTKTCAYEISEQLGWAAPSHIFLPVGNGTLLLGLCKGFRDLQKAGIILKLPELIAVQSDVCCPVYDAFHRGEKCVKYGAGIADGINVADPVRMEGILEAVKETGGTVIKVKEKDIRVFQAELKTAGHYVEPTSAVGLAGMFATGIRADALVVLTGSLNKAS